MSFRSSPKKTIRRVEIMAKKNLVEARKAKNLSQADVANEIGISSRMYRYIESGGHDSRMATWLKLSKLFDCDIEYLMREFDETGKPVELEAKK